MNRIIAYVRREWVGILMILGFICLLYYSIVEEPRRRERIAVYCAQHPKDCEKNFEPYQGRDYP